jgi:hypothetical protein
MTRLRRFCGDGALKAAKPFSWQYAPPVERDLIRFLKGVILLSAVSVGVAAFYLFGSLVGFWGDIRSGVLARDGSRSPNVWPWAQEDGDGASSAYQRTEEKGEMDGPTGKVNPPKKGKKKVPPAARARRQAASR